MSVNPGFGGQKLIPYCLEKVKRLRSLREEKNYNYLISVDGGIDSKNVGSVIDAGADVIVSGSAFFSGDLRI